ncbi:MAG: hypothetical protein DHS20C15_23720 [Planctomycetota bacterium]|nr:MAG: hypothetical protein DHS20C15_23720 [Planctomycetota bacterium]
MTHAHARDRLPAHDVPRQTDCPARETRRQRSHLALRVPWATRAALAACFALAFAPACSIVALNDALARVTPAVVSDRAFAWGERPVFDDTAALPATQAEALQRFGPPGEVLGLVDGDVFVYRWREIELDTLNLHSGFVAPVALPLYGRLDGDQRDRSLMLSFDRAGKLRHAAIDGQRWGAGGAAAASDSSSNNAPLDTHAKPAASVTESQP